LLAFVGPNAGERPLRFVITAVDATDPSVCWVGDLLTLDKFIITSVGANSGYNVLLIIPRSPSALMNRLGLFRGLVLGLVLGLAFGLKRRELAGRVALVFFLIQLASSDSIGTTAFKDELVGEGFIPLPVPSSFRLQSLVDLLKLVFLSPSSSSSVNDVGVAGLESSVSRDDKDSSLAFSLPSSSVVRRLVNELPSDKSPLFGATAELWNAFSLFGGEVAWSAGSLVGVLEPLLLRLLEGEFATPRSCSGNANAE
jgi:hypothetical protein